jgi:hypothetical protein
VGQSLPEKFVEERGRGEPGNDVILVFLAALGVFAQVTEAPAMLGHAAIPCNNSHGIDSQYKN